MSRTLSPSAPSAPTRPRQWTPVLVLAGFGAVFLALEVIVVARWVSGPHFTAVEVGVTEIETWRAIVLQVIQWGFAAGALAILYFTVVRPWMRERRVGFDGLLALSALIISVFDPTSTYLHQWYTYNSYFVNFGSVMTSIPGNQPYAEPGAQVAFPIIALPGEYVVSFFLLSLLGSAILRALHRRFHAVRHINWLAATAMILILMFMSVLFEGFILLPLGVYQMSGLAPFEILGNHVAMKNFVFFGIAFGAAALARFHKNDRGETIVERGSDRVRGDVKRTGVRFLAVFSLMTFIMFVCYHIPVALWAEAENGAKWQDSMINNSFLNNQVCGVGTDRLCPGQTELVQVPAEGQ